MAIHRTSRGVKWRALLAAWVAISSCAPRVVESIPGDESRQNVHPAVLASASPVIQVNSSGARADHARRRPHSDTALIVPVSNGDGGGPHFVRLGSGTLRRWRNAATTRRGRSPPLTIS